MNKVILMGRLTRDPEVRYSQGGQQTAVCRYALAVNRSYRREGEPEADFINIVAFGSRGEFAAKYFRKGMMVAVVGELRISSYDDRDGNRRWSTDVVVNEQYFAESRASYEGRSQGQPQGGSSDFAPRQNYNNGGYQQRPQNNAPAYGDSYGQGGYGQSPYDAAPAAPATNQAPAYQQPQAPANDGFTPIDEDIEGDEDLPF